MKEKKVMKENKIDWLEISLDRFGLIGQHFEWSAHNIGGSLLTKHSIESGLPLVEIEESGHVRAEKDDPDNQRFVKMVEKCGGRILHKWVSKGYNTYISLLDDGLITLDVNGSYVKMSAISTNEKLVLELQELVSQEFVPPVQKGHIFAIIRMGMSLGLSTIGNAGIALEPGNYTSSVMEDYRAAIKDLNTANPSGRIVIMEGEPGTGKTHLIQAMLMEVPDAMFVLVSPEMVPSLAGPELLPLLLNQKNSYRMTGPIVLVLEDADRCLVTRGEGNLNNIQSLLNLGDGILGSLLDLRIVATTNAKKLEMEAALLRPGRLSKRLEVGSLDWDTARSVFRRLVPNGKFPEKLTYTTGNFAMSLAEVYSLARKAGWEPEKREISEDSNDLRDEPEYD